MVAGESGFQLPTVGAPLELRATAILRRQDRLQDPYPKPRYLNLPVLAKESALEGLYSFSKVKSDRLL